MDRVDVLRGEVEDDSRESGGVNGAKEKAPGSAREERGG